MRKQLGMAMFLIANIVGSSIQITCLPLPVLSTLQASGLVFNSICATLLLSEPFTPLSAIGTALVTVGAILIGIFGAMTEPSHTLPQLLDLLWRQEFLLWLGGTLFVVVLVLAATIFLRRIYPRPNSPKARFIRGMSFGFISGVLSAHLLLVAKSAVELLVRTIVDGHNQFDQWQSWIILIALLVLALTELYYLHRGLKLCSTSVLYPFVFCIYNIVTIVDGLIYFRQSSRLSNLHAGLIALGTVILLSGVLALSWRLNEPDKTQEEPPEAAARLRKRAFSRVATSSSALAPGMGFVPPSEDLNKAHEDAEDPSRDPESHTTGFRDDDDNESGHANEATPLLRTSTAPVSTVRGKKRKTLPQRPGSGRKRRMTVAEEGREIWDELLDRGKESRRGSEANLLSPSLRRHRGRRESWDGESGPAGSSEGISIRDEALDTGEDTDASVVLPDRERNPRHQTDGTGGWFRLWNWKRRWRKRDREDVG